MNADAIQFCRDYGIPFADSHKKATQGWLAVRECPWCGSTGYHLGIHLGSFATSCWRCGTHGRVETISKIARVTFAEARKILKQYNSGFESTWNKKVQASWLEIPEHRKEFPTEAINYLEKRGFDAETLRAVYDIRYAGFAGKLAHRIIFPIYYQDKLISYTARSILSNEHLDETGQPRYWSCPKAKEVKPHKEILYGIDLTLHSRVIVCEGPLDAVKLGPGAVATFGIDFTEAQVRLLATKYSECAILFDSEPQAQRQAKKLAHRLSGLGLETEVVTLPHGDPGDLTQEQAADVMKQLLFTT